jgi:hypothetical protein
MQQQVVLYREVCCLLKAVKVVPVAEPVRSLPLQNREGEEEPDEKKLEVEKGKGPDEKVTNEKDEIQDEKVDVNFRIQSYVPRVLNVYQLFVQILCC